MRTPGQARAALARLLVSASAGVLRGPCLASPVAGRDTVERTLVALGPVTIMLTRELRLGRCPICTSALHQR